MMLKPECINLSFQLAKAKLQLMAPPQHLLQFILMN